MVASFFIDKCPTGTICIHNQLYFVDQDQEQSKMKPLSRKITFRVWSRNAADSLIDPLAMPGVNLSCFGAGSDTGDKGSLIPSTEYFEEFHEFPCGLPFKSVRTITKTKKGISKTKICQNIITIFITCLKNICLVVMIVSNEQSTKLEGK